MTTDTSAPASQAFASTPEPLISVQRLRKSFGAHEVLKGIDLDVYTGEVVTIIGASGSGKSTLLRCLNLLETPNAGHVYFRGEDLTNPATDVNALRADIGMVFQSFNLFNNLNVLDNCTLAPVTLGKLKKPEAEKIARRHLEAVGLQDFIGADSKAAKSSAWPLPAPCAWTRPSCSSTSLPAPWTLRSWARCWASCASWRPAA